MRVTIVPDSGLVVLAGERHRIDLSGLVPDFVHAVQWDGVKGHIEYKESRNADGVTEKPHDTVLTTEAEFLKDFGQCIDACSASTLIVEPAPSPFTEMPLAE